MSDISQGPGWWIASDGQWYPPELHPDARATADVAASSVVREETAASQGWPGAGSWEPSVIEGRQENGTGTVPHWATMPGDALESPPVMSNGGADVASSALPARTITNGHRSPKRGRTPLLAVMAVVVLVAGGVLVYSLTQGQGTSLAGDSPHQVVALATEAAQAAGSVHVVVHLQGPGQTATYVDDSATDSGQQVITSSGGPQVTTLVVGNTAYVKANQAAMTNLFQSTDAVARRYANTWLSFPSSGAAYKQIADAVTLVSLLKEVTPSTSAATLTSSVMDGRSVVGVRGELPGRLPGTLYVAATGSPLPVEEVTRASGAVTTAVFTDWGESVPITAPTGAVAGSAVPSLFGQSAAANDRAAESDLTHALTEVLALFQTNQTFCQASCAAGLTPLSLATIQSTAPEFTWSNGAVTSGTGVSIQPVDVTAAGRGDGVILAVRSADANTCWYAVELQSAPTSAFSDTAPNLDFTPSPSAVGTGQSVAPVGGTVQKMGAGVFYASATVGGPAPGSPTAAQGCTAGFPVGSPAGGPTTWRWGSSFSNAPNL